MWLDEAGTRLALNHCAKTKWRSELGHRCTQEVIVLRHSAASTGVEQRKEQQYFCAQQKMSVALDVEQAFDVEQPKDAEQSKDVEQAQRGGTEERSAILFSVFLKKWVSL